MFSESRDFKKTNKTKKKSTHRFLGNATYNTCAKFQGKIVNPTLVRALEGFRILNKSQGFR